MINDGSEYKTSRLENYKANGELNIPFHLLAEQTATFGAEWNREELNDPASIQATSVVDEIGNPANIGGVSGSEYA